MKYGDIPKMLFDEFREARLIDDVSGSAGVQMVRQTALFKLSGLLIAFQGSKAFSTVRVFGTVDGMNYWSNAELEISCENNVGRERLKVPQLNILHPHGIHLIRMLLRANELALQVGADMAKKDTVAVV